MLCGQSVLWEPKETMEKEERGREMRKKYRKYSCLVFDKYIGYVWFRGSKPCVNISDTSHLLFRLKMCFCTPQRHNVLSARPRKYLLSIFCFCFISPPCNIDLFQSCFKNVCVCVRVCASVSAQERWKTKTKLCWKRNKDFFSLEREDVLTNWLQSLLTPWNKRLQTEFSSKVDNGQEQGSPKLITHSMCIVFIRERWKSKMKF